MNQLNIDERFYDLVTKLWSGGSWAYYWTDNEGQTEPAYSQWFPVTDIKKVGGIFRNVNAYFGVNPSSVKKGMRERTELSDVQAVNCLFAEFDLSQPDDSQRMLNSINDMDCPPSVIVFSGGGYHCYWLLSETYHIHSEAARTAIIAIQYAWNQFVGADGAAKDIARVLRIPGALNRKAKYAPNYPTVEIVKFEMDSEYDLSDLQSMVQSIIDEEKKPVTDVTTVAPVNVPSNISQRLEKMLHDDLKAAALFGGDMSQHGHDHSKADQALCNRLAFWFGRDRDSIDQAFRQSGLMRDKWDRDDYRKRTLDRSIADTTKVFNPEENRDIGDVGALVGLHANKDATKKEKRIGEAVTSVTAQTDRPAKCTTADYILSLAKLGYEFRLNELDDVVEVNGRTVDDTTVSTMNSGMRDLGYTQIKAIWDAIVTSAGQARYHPIKEYLEGLQWDGTDWIAILSGFFADDHEPIVYSDGRTSSVFAAWLKRWLIGSVSRVYKHNQNPVLVLDGGQGMGKSHFVNWLGSEVGEYLITGPVKPDEKDHQRFLIKKWIWEVAELGATTRRQDVEALKAFLTLEQVTVRKPYDRHEISKRPMANFIGTINNEIGFLTDTTGNRRYISVHLSKIDHAYCEVVPVSQLWAQAYALWSSGEESFRLTLEEISKRDEINRAYQIDDPHGDWITKFFDVDADQPEWRTTTQEIVSVLQDKGFKGDTRAIQMQVAKALKSMSLEQDSNARPRTWRGVKAKGWEAK